MSDPSTSSRTRAWVEVRLDHLRENAAATRVAAGPRAGLVPMVKADAYGLGLSRVVATLGNDAGGAPWAFGVAAVAEGERVREAGWAGRILVFSPAHHADFSRAADAGLTLCLSDVAAVEALAALSDRRGERLPFHLEVDTGMGRAGFLWSEVDAWSPRVAAASGSSLRWEGTYTHFHSSDEPDLAPTDEQWRRFQETIARLPRVEPAPVVHVANSAAAHRRAGYGCDLARPGIYLYGGAAGPEVVPRPVVSLHARVVLVREVPAGSTVGYGATYRASGDERWGTLGIGYGDGVPRALARGGGEAIVRGRRVPIIGRVSMDMITVDLTGLPDAEVGDVATLIGEQGGESIGVDEVAQRCGTISYEILTGLTPRLPRVYTDGEPAATLQG